LIRANNIEVHDDIALDLFADYYKFFCFFWPELSSEDMIPNWHIKEIARELQFLSEFIVRREAPPYEDLFITVPPGSTKSSLVTQGWPIWNWLGDPSLVWIIDSYSSDASLNHAIKAKNILKSEMFQTVLMPYFEKLHGKKLELIRDNNDDFINNFGGRYYATSTTGTVTSMHAHCLIFDDAMNAVIADSDTKRAASNRALELTFPSRKIDKRNTPSIYLMQRFHEDDTIGHFMKKSRSYHHICLPAELTSDVKPAELREKYIDGLLDPVRMPREVLDKARLELGSFGYSGQYLQQPYPEEGGRIKKDWFVTIEAGEVPDSVAWDLWIDGAYTKDKDNDPTGFMIAGFDLKNGRMIVRHFEEQWMTTPEVTKRIKEIHADYLDNASMIEIEPKASGYSFIQLIRDETLFNVTRITGRLVQDGKLARVNYAAPKIESGRVHLVRGNWNQEYITQMVAFPNYSHDEACDLTGYAVKKYFG